MGIFGPAYDEALDGCRIAKQLDRVRVALILHEWASLAELADRTGDPESSISAQLRHLRKARFGGYTIDKRRRGHGGTWEYRLVPPDGGEHV